MQNWTEIVQSPPKSAAPIEIAIMLFPDFSNLCLANAVEPLRAVNRIAGRACYRWRYLGLDAQEVTSSSGLTVRLDGALSRSEGGDYLFVMPSYEVRRHDTPACRRMLRAARGRFARLAGLDTGSWLLASAGLLDGCRATIHREEQVALAERFPEVDVSAARVVDDGDILSCGGALTTFELVLGLIERHQGALTRLEIAALFLDGATDRPGPAAPRPGQTAEAAMAVMLRHIETPLPLREIAARIGLSQKRLEQRCRARYGIAPQELYIAVRLRAARRLVETTALSVSEIALRCGYADPSALTRAFRRAFGQTPRSLRSAVGRGGPGPADAPL